MKAKLIVSVSSVWRNQGLMVWGRFEKQVSIPVLPVVGQKIELVTYPGLDPEALIVKDEIIFALTGDTLIPEIWVRSDFIYEVGENEPAKQMHAEEEVFYRNELKEHFEELGFKAVDGDPLIEAP
jgi:hypothetical protein